jgi:ADP-ribose pyrophosphatase YjhB (NUDIX family)
MVMTERSIRVGTRAVIFNENNEILVGHCLNPEDDYYFLPGGGVWFPEKIEDCLVREVQEETGFEVNMERLLWVRDFIEGFPDVHGIEIFFLATLRAVHCAANLCMMTGNGSNSRSWT